MELISILSAYLCPIRGLQKYPAQLCVNVNVKNSDIWLTVHRISMWNKKPTRCHLVLYLFLLYKLLNMFRATLCWSAGSANLVVFFHVWCSIVAV